MKICVIGTKSFTGSNESLSYRLTLMISEELPPMNSV